MQSGVISAKQSSLYVSKKEGSVDIPGAEIKVNNVLSFWATLSYNLGKINVETG